MLILASCFKRCQMERKCLSKELKVLFLGFRLRIKKTTICLLRKVCMSNIYLWLSSRINLTKSIDRLSHQVNIMQLMTISRTLHLMILFKKTKRECERKMYGKMNKRTTDHFHVLQCQSMINCLKEYMPILQEQLQMSLIKMS